MSEVKYATQALIPLSSQEIDTALEQFNIKLKEDPSMQPETAFVIGICYRERPDVPKPFPAPGAWFPIDVLGNPMREVSPGQWESPNTSSPQAVFEIITAYKRGYEAFVYNKPENDRYTQGDTKTAWELGYEYAKNNYSPESMSVSLVQRITTAYEQGVGQGQRTDVINPYKPSSPEYQAWNNGRETGKRNSDKNNAWS